MAPPEIATIAEKESGAAFEVRRAHRFKTHACVTRRLSASFLLRTIYTMLHETLRIPKVFLACLLPQLRILADPMAAEVQIKSPGSDKLLC